MPADYRHDQTAIRIDLGAIFVSLELSRATWLITSLSPGRQKMSKHRVRGGDIAGLLTRFAELRAKAQTRTGQLFPLIVIQEAGLDGFWIHRVRPARARRQPAAIDGLSWSRSVRAVEWPRGAAWGITVAGSPRQFQARRAVHKPIDSRPGQ